MQSAVHAVLVFAAVGWLCLPAARADEGKAVKDSPTTSEISPSASKRVDYSVYSDVAKSAALAGEQINWQVVAGGGTTSSSPSFVLSGTVGQAAVGFVSSSSYGLNQGFWQTFSGGAGCCVLRGDVDGSGALNVSDLTFLVSFLFQGGPAASCADHADVDGSTAINVSDLTFLVSYLFQGGPAPGAC